MSDLPMDVDRTGSGLRCILRGDLSISTLTDRRADLAAGLQNEDVVCDISGVSRLDTAGAWMLIDLKRRLGTAGHEFQVTGGSDGQIALLEAVERNWPAKIESDSAGQAFSSQLHDLGKTVVGAAASGLEVLSLSGEVLLAGLRCLIRPLRLRWTSLVYHMQDAGLNAVPIVVLMAFLIGIVLAFQGASQLRQFGAEIFVVDLIAVSILRELGILLTAIIVAGRSSSAMTASIGSMKMREEIDAMRTLGLDPVEVLVLPRVLALFMTLPVLGFIADMAGLIGGGLMAWIDLGISPSLFMARVNSSVDGWQFAIGIIKAPFFAVTIGIVGCYMGLKVEGNAESLGKLTSKSVVVSIFLVIVIDAVFSIFFSALGV